MESRWEPFLRVAARLALRGYGLTSPNPLVGAVIVEDNDIIGRGWHRGVGYPHAEVEAIEDAKASGHKIEGTTMVVTLEPCCTWGRTPPCTERLIREKIGRVIVGTIDPNPRHAGRGLEVLRQNGIAAECVEWGPARELLKGFEQWIKTGRPLVLIKFAASLDGRIATSSGNSKWITGQRARAVAMRIRQGVDAVLVGVETVCKDDPELTVRWGRRYWVRQPWRLVLDPMGRIPPTARLLNDQFSDRTVVFVGEGARYESVARLQEKVEVISLQRTEDGQLDLAQMLTVLGQRGITRLLVEGGGLTIGGFLEQGLGDEAYIFLAPIIIGGRSAPRAIRSRRTTMHWKLEGLRLRVLDQDLLLMGRIKPAGP